MCAPADAVRRCKRRHRSDALAECNPYFLSVHRSADTAYLDRTGGPASIREEVGSRAQRTGLRDRSLRAVPEQPGLVATRSTSSRDTAPDDGLVTVDRGFLSVTDEGAHRRVRVLKVYRIEDLELPHDWLCPLWASQVAIGGWWC